MEHYRNSLRLISIFQDLSDEQLDRIWELSTVRDYKKKTTIFHEGTSIDAIYFVLDGLIKTFKTDEHGNEHIVSILKKRDLFPHTGFLERLSYPATAEAIVHTKLLSLSVEALELLIIEAPAISLQMMRMMGEKIRELQEKLQQLAGQDVQERCISFLLQLAEHYGRWESGHIHIDVPLTNQEFASAIGTSRETVNRLINQLRKEGILGADRHRLIILDYDKLELSSK